MIKPWILASVLSLALAGASLAHDHRTDSLTQKEERFVYLPQISQEEIQQFMEHSSETILVCPQGITLPLTFFLTGELLEIETNDHPGYTLSIKQAFYLRWQEEELCISLDGSGWKNWREMLTGTISFNLNVQTEGPQLQLGAEVFIR